MGDPIRFVGQRTVEMSRRQGQFGGSQDIFDRIYPKPLEAGGSSGGNGDEDSDLKASLVERGGVNGFSDVGLTGGL